MKNVFGLDLSQDAKKRRFDGDIFISAQLDAYQQTDVGNALLEMEMQRQAAHLPFSLQMLGILSFAIGIGAIMLIFKLDGTFIERFQRVPSFFYAAGIGFLLSGILEVLDKWKYSKRTASNKYRQSQEKNKKILKNAEKMLEIPENSHLIDLLCFDYTAKMVKNLHIPFELRFYADDECFYFANPFTVYRFYRSDIARVEYIPKRIAISEWHKPEKTTSSKYRPYKITYRNGKNSFKGYYSVQLRTDFGDFELLIPPYDFDIVKSTLSLTVKDKETTV